MQIREGHIIQEILMNLYHKTIRGLNKDCENRILHPTGKKKKNYIRDSID